MGIINFGIFSTGAIAEKFTTVCTYVEGSCAYGVASRTADKAQAFAQKTGVKRFYGSYEEMVKDPDIHAVYVATPHPMHFENCMLALQNGKHVLCEKPMVMTREQAVTLFEYAKQSKLFLMEAMWSRFVPNMLTAKRWIDEGVLGKLHFIDVMLTFAVGDIDAGHRLVDPALGGGSLYDLGIYTVELSSFLAGANPVAYTGLHTDFCKGTDATAAIAAKYPGGLLATMRTGIVADSHEVLTVVGDKGRIEITRPHFANNLKLYLGDTLTEEIQIDYDMPRGHSWQLAAVCDYIRDGVTESPIVPYADTIAAIEMLETLKKGFDSEKG